MELCDGLEHDSYSVLLQCLSDVEWLVFLQTTHVLTDISMTHSNNDDNNDVMLAQCRPSAGVQCWPGSGSLVDELFAFQLVTGRLCDSCHQLSVSIQPCYILTLPLPPGTAQCRPSIDSCLRHFTGTEYQPGVVPCVRCDRDGLVLQSGGCVVGGRDIFACMDVGSRHIYRPSSHVTSSRDRGGRGCQLRSLVSKCPPYLIIHLDRYNLTTRVSVARRLLLGNGVVIGDRDVTRYRLRAAVCCQGHHEVGQGHHDVTYASCDDVTWYRFDDVTVIMVNIDQELMSEFLERNVYLLIYRRISASS